MLRHVLYNFPYIEFVSEFVFVVFCFAGTPVVNTPFGRGHLGCCKCSVILLHGPVNAHHDLRVVSRRDKKTDISLLSRVD